MREDIVGMLKNAIDHGGNPVRVAQSLINSGYPMKDVREAFDYVMSSNPQLSQNQAQVTQPQTQQTSQAAQDIKQKKEQISVQSMPSVPSYPPNFKSSQLQQLKPLPSQRINPSGTGKIVVLVIILVLLILSLISVVVFKDTILDLLEL